MALSCKTMTEHSIRDHTAQISEGRFEPNVFDANIQTDRELLDIYMQKETHSADCATDPVKFQPPVVMAQMMCQTDPEIWEPRNVQEL